jgi:hypothetical protein
MKLMHWMLVGQLLKSLEKVMPIPVAARSKAWVCGRSLAGIAGSNPTGGMDVCVVFVVRTVEWNVKWHEGRKDLNCTKMDPRGKTPDRQKKNPVGGLDVCRECCELSGRGIFVGLITYPEKSYRGWCVWVSVIVKPRKMRRSCPTQGCSITGRRRRRRKTEKNTEIVRLT